MDRFSDVFRMYYNRVYRFLLSLTGSIHQAEELTQEVFYRALFHIQQYQDDGHMYAWLCSIGKNAWIDYCRKNRHMVPLKEDDIPFEASAEDIVVKRELQLALQKAILTLPEEYQEVVILHIYGEIPLKEIAAKRGKSESWGKVTFYRAKIMLRKRLEELM